jgi:hypothetical protein
VAGIVAGGSADLRVELAAPLALHMMSDLLDLDDVRPEDILGWYHEIVDAVHVVTLGGDVPEPGLRAFAALGEAVGSSAGRSHLLGPIVGDSRLSAEEIVFDVSRPTRLWCLVSWRRPCVSSPRRRSWTGTPPAMS